MKHLICLALFCSLPRVHAAVRNYKCVALLADDGLSNNTGFMLKGAFDTTTWKATGDILLSSINLGDDWGSDEHPLVLPKEMTTIYPTGEPEHAFEVSATSPTLRVHFTYIPFAEPILFEIRNGDVAHDFKGTCRFENGDYDAKDWIFPELP